MSGVPVWVRAAAATVAAVAVVAVAAEFAVWQPLRDRAAQAEADAQALEDRELEVRAEIAEAEASPEQLDDLAEIVDAVEAMVPDAAQLPSLVAQLDDAAAHVGVDGLRVSFAEPREGAAGVAVVPVEVSVTGEVADVAEFFAEVDGPRVPRAVVWDRWTLAGGDGDEVTLVAEGDAATRAPLAGAADDGDGDGGEPVRVGGD